MSRILLQQAFIALRSAARNDGNYHDYNDVADALEAELAKPEQEPIAHLWECIGRWSAYLATNGKQGNLAPPTWLVDAVKAVTAPSKPWVGLTQAEINRSISNLLEDDTDPLMTLAYVIEEKLKEKNGIA
jgi:hypothetical protein